MPSLMIAAVLGLLVAAAQAPPQPSPAQGVRIVPSDGTPGDSVYNGQPFRLEASVPASGAPPVMSATLTTPDGQTRTVPLVPSGTSNGMATFTSPQISFDGGRLAPGTLQDLDVTNGQIVTATVDGAGAGGGRAQTGVAVFTDDVQQGISRVNENLNATADELVKQRGFVDAQMQDPAIAADPAQMQNLREWRADIDRKMSFVSETRRLMTTTDMPGLQLMYGQRRLDWLSSNWDSFDPREWYGSARDVFIREEFRERVQTGFTDVMRAYTMGTYQQIARMSMVAQVRAVTTGYDEFNKKLSAEELAAEKRGLALDLAMFWAPKKFSDYLVNGGKFSGEFVLTPGTPSGRVLVPPRGPRTATGGGRSAGGAGAPPVTGSKPPPGVRPVEPPAVDNSTTNSGTRTGTRTVDDADSLKAAKDDLRSRKESVEEVLIDEDMEALINKEQVTPAAAKKYMDRKVASNAGLQERLKLQELSVRRNNLTDADLEWLQNQLAKDPNYFANLSRRWVSYEDLNGRPRTDGLRQYLDADSARNLADAYAAAQAARARARTAGATPTPVNPPTAAPAANPAAATPSGGRPSTGGTPPPRTGPGSTQKVDVDLAGGSTAILPPGVGTGAKPGTPTGTPSTTSGGAPAPPRTGGSTPTAGPDAPLMPPAGPRDRADEKTEGPSVAPPSTPTAAGDRAATGGTKPAGGTTTPGADGAAGGAGSGGDNLIGLVPGGFAPTTVIPPIFFSISPGGGPGNDTFVTTGGGAWTFDPTALANDATNFTTLGWMQNEPWRDSQIGRDMRATFNGGRVVIELLTQKMGTNGATGDAARAVPGTTAAAPPAANAFARGVRSIVEALAGLGMRVAPAHAHRLAWAMPSAPALKPVRVRVADLARAQGAGRSAMPPIRMLISSLGSSTGDAFRLQVLNQGAAPVQLDWEGVVLEPIKGVGQNAVAKMVQEFAGKGAVAGTVSGYCYEFLKQPPTAGQLFRIAPQELQKHFEPLRKVMQAANRLEQLGVLKPDSNPATYFNSIRQWAIWAKEQRFNGDTFKRAFVDFTRKQVAAASQQWTREIEQAVERAIPHRWSEVQRVLAESEK